MSTQTHMSHASATARESRPAQALRTLGALTLLAVGAVHLEEYAGNHYSQIPTIGILFLLNFVGAVVMGLLLLAPTERLVDRLSGRGGRAVVALLALAAIGLSVVAFIFLFVSEGTQLFGFMEQGYRPAIIVALAAEAATTVLLGSYLLGRLRKPRGRKAATAG